MSCEYCSGKPMAGSDGYFVVSKRRLRRRDDSEVTQPILRYEASDSLFSSDVEIDDHIVIRHCPMCGEEL